MRNELLKQLCVGAPEESLGSRSAIRAPDVKVVYGSECRELARTEAMAAVVIERELAVASLDSGTAALEQISAFTGNLLDVHTLLGREALQQMLRMAKRFKELRAERAQLMACHGASAALGDAHQVERWN